MKTHKIAVPKKTLVKINFPIGKVLQPLTSLWSEIGCATQSALDIEVMPQIKAQNDTHDEILSEKHSLLGDYAEGFVKNVKADNAQLLKKGEHLISNEKNCLNLSAFEVKTAAYLILFSIAFRLIFINYPFVTVFDEVHFGLYALKYQNQEFFLDVHPPLGKLILAQAAKLGGGIPSDFLFNEVGLNYVKAGVPYMTMRAVSSIFGALIVPLTYILCKNIGIENEYVGLLVSGIVLFENAYTSVFRLIMLDSMLLFFSASAFLMAFSLLKDDRFSARWTIKLLLCSIFIGFSISTKWVGLFSLGYVAFLFLRDWWNQFCNPKISANQLLKDAFAKFGSLFIVPLLIYVGVFWIHFNTLTRFTDESSELVSPRFRASLIDGKIPATPKMLFYGARVVIKHYRRFPVALHSHLQPYPKGSQQQQITGYKFHDENNIFIVRKATASDPPMKSKTITKRVQKKVPKAKLLQSDGKDAEKIQQNNTASSGPNDDDDVRRKIEDENRQNNPNTDTAEENKTESLDQPNEEEFEIVEEDVTEEIFYRESEREDETTKLDPVLHGDVIRLEHEMTGRFLHSHFIDPHVSNKDNYSEVTGYGGLKSNISDNNDDWTIQITDDKGNITGATGQQVECISSYIRLTHSNIKCILQTSKKTLPDWGYFQHEVVCGRDTKVRNGVWLIAVNDHPLNSDKTDLEEGSIVPKNFYEKFVELNRLMWDHNHSLQSHHDSGSRPWTWPFMLKGINMWNFMDVPLASDKILNGISHLTKKVNPSEIQYKANPDPALKNRMIYLIGNPFSWFCATAALLFVFFAYGFGILIAQRNIFPKFAQFSEFVFYSSTENLAIGWLFHWLPFNLLTRQLFLHHYFPAHFFAIILLGLFINNLHNRVINRLSLRWQRALYIGFATLIVATFAKFSALTYGFALSREQCNSLKFFSSRWNFDCEVLRRSAPVASSKI